MRVPTGVHGSPWTLHPARREAYAILVEAAAGDHRRLIERHARSAFASKRTEDARCSDIARLRHELCATPYAASHLLRVLSSMFGWTIRHGLLERARRRARALPLDQVGRRHQRPSPVRPADP